MALDPAILSSRLHRVHNKGEISRTSAQLAILRSLATVNEGEWSAAAEGTQEADDGKESVMGNAAYLQL